MCCISIPAPEEQPYLRAIPPRPLLYSPRFAVREEHWRRIPKILLHSIAKNMCYQRLKPKKRTKKDMPLPNDNFPNPAPPLPPRGTPSLPPRRVRTKEEIRDEYLELRIEELDEKVMGAKKRKAMQDRIEALMRKNGVVNVPWQRAYLKIRNALRTKVLTINIEASSWFSQQNLFPTYSQMYERAVVNGTMKLKDTPVNPAVERAVVDDVVTIPDKWGDPNQLDGRKKRLHAEFNASGAKRSARAATTLPQQADGSYETTNPQFRPDAKQVFAALNYGMRANGSTTFYGHSYLILKAHMRKSALYYPGDTFETFRKGTKQQASYDSLGVVLHHATDALADAIWQSCYTGIRLANTAESKLLLEAHLFRDVKVAEDIEALILSDQRTLLSPWQGKQWDRIKTNAREWCVRNKVRQEGLLCKKWVLF